MKWSQGKKMNTSVNNFVINIATANGTGSQSSNLIILHTMFEMGIPVSGKNLFPSNISGAMRTIVSPAYADPICFFAAVHAQRLALVKMFS